MVCRQCDGKGKVRSVGYTVKDCVVCGKKGFVFEHVDPLSLPPFPTKEAVTIPKRVRAKPKGSLKNGPPTFTEFVRDKDNGDK